jgi:transcriptional regulator with XRE-family HTH domain
VRDAKPSTPTAAGAELAEIIAVIWERVEPLRLERGLSIERLAATCGVSTATLSRLRRGLQDDPRLSTVLRLRSGLGVPSDELLGDLPLPYAPRPQWAAKRESAT